MDALPREILICQTEDGREPFSEWLNDQLDRKTRAIVRVRIDRVQDGNFGDVRAVGEGVSELRIDVGPGYRVYFGQKGYEVHLLLGGSKQTQEKDIIFAKAFWRKHE